ncbi:2146_t:CDS:2 [Rhizophagus irregularis]|nr:2146_t:CDS:2 [Rhizophagus irregularis]
MSVDKNKIIRPRRQTIMQYQVKETPSSAICGKEYIQKNAFTGNAISHLRLKYDITQTEEKVSMKER